MFELALKRIYESPSPGDGWRVLVDRLWPRGLSKDKAAVDHWTREVAPSNELRKWFSHDIAKWPEFKSRYKKELEKSPAFENLLLEIQQKDKVTLLYAAKDDEHNNAVVLAELLHERGKKQR